MSVPDLISAIEAVDVTKLSPKEQANAIFKGTENLHALMEHSVCTVVIGQIGKSDAEQSIAATYYRVALLVRGLVASNDPKHFQIANSVARTIFELVIDLKLLCYDHTLAAKYLAFARVVKFRKAVQLVEFLNDNPGVDRSTHQYAITFASNPQRKQVVEQLCIQHWGANKHGQPRWPEHWSGKTIADRAHDAGLEFEEMYRSQFFLQSQYVHAGPAGIQNLSPEALISSFGIAHRLIQQLAATATELVGEAFHLFDANPDLPRELRRVSAAAGYYAVEAVLRIQGNVTVDGTGHESQGGEAC